jgi:hypothetical protein
MPDIADIFRAKNYDVFVSYKREDDAARTVLVEKLEAAGYVVFWDAKLNNDEWKGELRDEINRCKLVICLWSERAAKSENVKAEAYGAYQLSKLLCAPIEQKTVVLDYFKGTNIHPFDEWADEIRRGPQIEKILGTVERVTGKPRRKPEPVRPMLGSSLVASPEFGDIPGAPDKLIGRDAELAMLHNAWSSRTPHKINAVVFHALGGAGKSALLRTFANELLAAGSDGASRIHGWSPTARAQASRSAPTPTRSSPRRSAISAGRAICRRTRSSAAARWRSSSRRSACCFSSTGWSRCRTRRTSIGAGSRTRASPS